MGFGLPRKSVTTRFKLTRLRFIVLHVDTVSEMPSIENLDRKHALFVTFH